MRRKSESERKVKTSFSSRVVKKWMSKEEGSGEIAEEEEEEEGEEGSCNERRRRGERGAMKVNENKERKGTKITPPRA